jgi:mannose-6-phosphate isomerase-like protein (cupin superfamily)
MTRAICVRRTEVQPFAFGDLQIWDYKPDEEQTSSLALIQIKPGISHGLSRSHRSDKYYYVLSGLVEFEVGEITYWLTQGDLLIIPKGEWFDYRNGANDMATLVLVHTPSFDLNGEEFAGETRT